MKEGVVIVVQSISAELETFLPIVREMRARRPDLATLAVFFSKRLLTDTLSRPFVARQFDEIVDVHVVGTRYSKRSRVKGLALRAFPLGKLVAFPRWLTPSRLRELVREWRRRTSRLRAQRLFDDTMHVLDERGIEPRAILKKHTSDGHFLRTLQDAYPQATCVVMAHGEAPRASGDESQRRHSKADLLLVHSEHHRGFYSALLNSDGNTHMRVETVGYTRYDRLWREGIVAAEAHRRQREREAAREATESILFLSRPASTRKILDADTRLALLDEVFDAVFARPNAFLFMKPHPREDAAELRGILSRYDARRWMISNAPVLFLADLADLTVAMYTSAVMDVLAQSKPVIEHFRFEHGYMGLEERDGKFISSYAALGVCPSTSTPQELRDELSRYFDSAVGRRAWTQQVEEARRFLGLTEGAAEKGSGAILDVMN